MLCYIILLVLIKGIPVPGIQIHVCRYPNSSGSGFIFECCSDYYEVNHQCIACRPGTYGKNCTQTCSPPFYGLGCLFKCDCTSDQICDLENGCVSENDNSTMSTENITECSAGSNCSQICPCQYGMTCDSETGSCTYIRNNTERPDVTDLELGSPTIRDQGNESVSTLQVYLVMTGVLTGIIMLTIVCVKLYHFTNVKCFKQPIESENQNRRNIQNIPIPSHIDNGYSPTWEVRVQQEALETSNTNPDQDIYYEISEI